MPTISEVSISLYSSELMYRIRLPWLTIAYRPSGRRDAVPKSVAPLGGLTFENTMKPKTRLRTTNATQTIAHRRSCCRATGICGSLDRIPFTPKIASIAIGTAVNVIIIGTIVI